MERRFLIIGSFAAIYLLWGSTYFAIALGLQSMPPFMLMGIRSLCGGLILIGLGVRAAVLCRLPRHPRPCAAEGAIRNRRYRSRHDSVLDCIDRFSHASRRASRPSHADHSDSGLCRRHHCSVAKYQPEWRRHPPDPVAARCGAVMVGWHRIIPTDVERRLFHIHLRYAAFARRYRALSDQLVVGRDAPLLSERGLNGFPSGCDLPDHGWERCRFCGLSLAARQCADPTGFNLHFCKPGHRRAVGDGLPWRTALSRHAFRRLSCYRFHYCDVAYRTFSLAVTCQRKAIGDQTAFDAQGLLGIRRQRFQVLEPPDVLIWRAQWCCGAGYALAAGTTAA